METINEFQIGYHYHGSSTLFLVYTGTDSHYEPSLTTN